jgi:hypothetical protein
MFVGWKALDTRSNSLTIDLSEDEELDEYWTDKIVRPEQVIYWPNFVTKGGGRRIRIRRKILHID